MGSWRPTIVLDTETTGLLEPHPWAVPIALAAIVLRPDGSLGSRFTSLMRPAIEPPRGAQEALDINKISREQLQAAPSTPEVLANFRAFWEAEDGPPVTAFRKKFDEGMLKRIDGDRFPWADCIAEQAADIMGPAGALIPVSRNVDRLKIARGGKWKQPSLATACEFFGVPFVPDLAHDPLYDAERAAVLLRAIRAHHDHRLV